MRIVRTLVVIALSYLLLVNAALQIPLTQSLVNMARPDKFNVSWDRAWSWYPFRVHVTGLSANGQSRSQQWQLDTPRASGSIAVLPLLLKKVRVSDLAVTDIDYRQRPRLKEDKDYEKAIPYFADIEGRDIEPAINSPRKKKKAWHIALSDLQATGKHSFWIYQAKGGAEGEIDANLTFQTQGGPFSLDIYHLDLELDSVNLNKDREVITRGVATGKLSFAPFVPRQDKGVDLLQFLSLDLETDIDLKSLAFLDLFLLNLDGITVDGVGRASGKVRYDKGTVLSGTSLSVDATDLLVNILAHQIKGAGSVDLNMGPQTSGQLDLAFAYEGLEVRQHDEEQVLLNGQELQLRIGGNGDVLPDANNPNTSRSVKIVIDELSIPDLSSLQTYLPAKWPFKLYGGNGTLHGSSYLSFDELAVDMKLESTGADLGFKDYRFGSSVEIALKTHNSQSTGQRTDLGGSYVTLKDAYLRREDEGKVESWNASVTINASDFSSTENHTQAQTQDKLRSLSDASSSEVLDSLTGSLDFDATTSSLAWIGRLFGDDYKLGVTGAGAINGRIHLDSGWPAADTRLSVTTEGLTVNVLDYVSQGTGAFKLAVHEGEDHPDWLLELDLLDADLKRSNEATAYIDEVILGMAATLPNVAPETKIKPSSLKFEIRSATVSDMSTFNSYLPKGGDFRINGGTADLTASIELQADDADGWLNLRSRGMQAELAEQSVSADLSVDVLLVGGVPADMEFDISGSQVRLDNAKVVGDEAVFDGNYWSAVFTLEKAETTWVSPMRMNLEASLSVSDSRPVVAIFENQGRRPEFLSRMLTVEDIEGTASVKVTEEQLNVIDAHAISDNIEIAARGIFIGDEQNAMLYMRYKKADGLLKFQDGKKNLDIISVKKKFDEFHLQQ